MCICECRRPCRQCRDVNAGADGDDDVVHVNGLGNSEGQSRKVVVEVVGEGVQELLLEDVTIRLP